MRIRILLLVSGSLATVWLAPAAHAGESELDEAPAPASADDVRSALKRAFEPREPEEPMFPELKRAWQGLPPFFSDARLGLHYRTAAFFQERVDGSESTAWAMGGWVEAETGEIAELLSGAFKYYLSAPIVAPDRKPGTLLLEEPTQDTLAVLGVANASLRWRDFRLTGGRLEISAPYLNGQDNRMIPNTFEGILLVREAGALRGGAAYQWRIKPRDADEFISMAERAGSTGTGGVASAGLRWDASEKFYLGVVDHFADDVFNTLYAEFAYTLPLGSDRDAKLEAQFTDQRSVGRNKVGDFDTQSVGVRLAGSALGGVARLGFAVTTKGGGVRSPWGSNPSYVDFMQRTFTRAGEEALLASLSWNFARIGLPGLSAIVNFANSWGARGPGSTSLADSREVDVTLDYRPEEGPLRGFWLRARGSWLGESGNADDGTDFRVLVNYDLPVF